VCFLFRINLFSYVYTFSQSPITCHNFSAEPTKSEAALASGRHTTLLAAAHATFARAPLISTGGACVLWPVRSSRRFLCRVRRTHFWSTRRRRVCPYDNCSIAACVRRGCADESDERELKI
jgi:hypothetical protein